MIFQYLFFLESLLSIVSISKGSAAAKIIASISFSIEITLRENLTTLFFFFYFFLFIIFL